MAQKKTLSPIKIGAKLAQADELAEKATSKLAREAGMREHCLLRLVLTANLIDDLDKEIESLQLCAMLPQDASKEFRWADMISEELEALQQVEREVSEYDDDGSDAGSEGYVELDEAITPPLTDMELAVHFKDEKCQTEQCADDQCGCIVDVTGASDLSLKRFPFGPVVSVVVTEVLDDSDISDPETGLLGLNSG